MAKNRESTMECSLNLCAKKDVLRKGKNFLSEARRQKIAASGFPEAAMHYLTVLIISAKAVGWFIAKSASTLRFRAIPLALTLPMNSE